MTRATIPARRKQLYLYTLLVLGAVLLVTIKSTSNGKAPRPSRAAEVNKLANTLFQ